ncbi:MAG: GTP cyclohydrolase IIa [Halobacteria archaeon]|nr:GTP cyclohydrolase IIa [Halobacteria archaeon]
MRHVEAETEVKIKVGVGVGKTPGEAGMKAKIGLEECRENGERVVMEE